MGEFPTPYVVQRHPYALDHSYDAHGNVTAIYGDTVDVPVYGWAAPQSDEPKMAGQARVAVTLEVYAPAGTTADPLDQFTVDGDLYDVVGEVEDYSHGPWQWQPGVVINLARWEG